MNELDLTVRRSALRMWLLAVLGVPFIIYGVDLLIERRLATTITDLIYPSENVTPPPFETHDLAWAWVFLVVGSVLTVWALKELIAPRRVVHADWHGVALAVGGPFASSVRLPWPAVDDFSAAVDADGAGKYPVLRMRVSEPETLPKYPWGARWGENGVLSIAAKDWDSHVEAVAERLSEMATLYRQIPEAGPVARADDETDTWTEVMPATPAPLPPSLVDGPWVRTDAELADEIRVIDMTPTVERPLPTDADDDEPILHDEPRDDDAGEVDGE